MNVTEAYEQVLRGAEMYLDTPRGKAAMPRLAKAVQKIKPRVERMRRRLDYIRASKAGKLNRPKWAVP